MTRSMLAAALGSALTLMAEQSLRQQNSEYGRQAQLAEDGAIFVSSDTGKLIKVADAGHCLEVIGAEDGQTMGCSVARGSGNLEERMQSQRIEIYMKNGRQSVIQTDGPITYWHFWEGVREVAVAFRAGDNVAHRALYNTANGKILREVDDPTDLSRLPQWAKSPMEVEDESVPEGDEYNRERTAWIAKMLRRIATIKPGMRRDELVKVLKTEGGLSTRFQGTYVYTECPYIKVTVQFKPVRNEQDGLTESPDDVIVSVSQPYLAWSVMD